MSTKRSAANSDKADGVSNQCSGKLTPFDALRNLVVVTPVGNPVCLLYGGRDNTRQPEPGHAAIHERLEDVSFVHKPDGIEREGDGVAVGECGDMRKSLGII